MEELNWDFNEVIIASSGNYVTVIHPKTGKNIKSYGANTMATKCLALLGQEYFIGASLNIPDIKMWPVADESSVTPINSPCGLVNALTVSNCGTYCIAAVKQEIRIWNVQSGEMLSAFTRHYQDVTVLKFTSDDSIFISGGKDGIVQAFSLAKMTDVNVDDPSRVKPLHCWKNHTKEVTDVFVGSLGIYSRIASTSIDSTCRIYELNTGLLLITLCLDVPITSVTIDSLEYYLILGTQKGTICKINLFDEQPRTLHVNSEKDEITAHANAVISLSMSIVGDKFLSSALDSNIKLWEITTLSCILCIQCSDGPYRNAFFTMYPTPLTTQDEPYFTVTQLERAFIKGRSEKSESIRFKPHDKELSMIHAGSFDENFHPFILHGQKELLFTETASEDVKVENVYQEAFRGETMNDVREMNSQMYAYMMDQVFKSINPAASPPHRPKDDAQNAM